MKVKIIKEEEDKMKILGKYSVSSFIKLILDIVLGIFLALVSINLILFVISIVNPDFNIVENEVTYNAENQITSINQSIIEPSIRSYNGSFFYVSRNKFNVIMYRIRDIILFGFGIWLVYHLRKVFSTLIKKEPFIKENAVRIRIIGLITIIFELLRTFMKFENGLYLKNKVLLYGGNITPKFELNFVTIFLGLVIIVIAEIFRIGTQLKEEQELTI